MSHPTDGTREYFNGNHSPGSHPCAPPPAQYNHPKTIPNLLNMVQAHSHLGGQLSYAGEALELWEPLAGVGEWGRVWGG